MTTLQIQTPAWAEPLLSPARYKGAYGGRGSGKSHLFAEMLIEAHIMDPDTSSVCVREIQKSLSQSVKRLLELKIRDLGVGEMFEVQEAVIKRRNGRGLITFQGMQNHTSDSIKSLEGFDRAWVEEAQSISQRSLDLLRPTIRKPGSELWFSWNPAAASDPVDALLRGDNTPPDAVVVQVNWNDNPWFPDVLRAEMEYDRKRDPDKFAHIWGGGYLALSGARVFRNWRVEEFEAPPEAMFRFGADWGFATDPTVLVRCYVQGRTLYIDHEAYQVGCEIADTPDLFLTVPGAERWPIVADSSRPETISHMKRNGFPKILGAVKGAKSVEEGVEFLKSHDIVVHPRCRHVIDELTHYSYKTDPATNAVLPVLMDKDNHCIAEGELVLCERGLVTIENVTTDDRVWTRGGWQRVLFSGQTDTCREVVRVETTGGSVVCTPDHEIWTANGFVRADALKYGDEILHTKESPCLTLKSLSGTARTGADIPVHATGLIASTTSAETSFCIERYGFLPMALFRKAITFITQMKTQATMTWGTCAAFLRNSIARSFINGAMNASQSLVTISPVFATSQNLGMHPQKGSPSTGRLVRWLTKTLSRKPSTANSADKNFFQKNLGTSTGSVEMPASPLGAEARDLMTLSELVLNAESNSCGTSTAGPRLVRGHVVIVTAAGQSRRVYDLTVENHHEFVAGGVLVSNCLDAIRYALEGVRRIQQQKPQKVVILPTASRW